MCRIPVPHRALRRLILGGLSLMCLGGWVAGTADGFGDSPPPINQSIAMKRIGVAVAVAGAATALISAVALYLAENRPQAPDKPPISNP